MSNCPKFGRTLRELKRGSSGLIFDISQLITLLLSLYSLSLFLSLYLSLSLSFSLASFISLLFLSLYNKFLAIIFRHTFSQIIFCFHCLEKYIFKIYLNLSNTTTLNGNFLKLQLSFGKVLGYL